MKVSFHSPLKSCKGVICCSDSDSVENLRSAGVVILTAVLKFNTPIPNKIKIRNMYKYSIFRNITSDETISFELVQRHVSYCIYFQSVVETVFKKIDHKPDKGQIVKSHKNCVFIMFSRMIG